MACARVLGFRILAGRENEVAECLTRLDELQRQADGYVCRVRLISDSDPRHMMIITIWEDCDSADAFALNQETEAHMSHIKVATDQQPIAPGQFDIDSDPADLIARHRG